MYFLFIYIYLSLAQADASVHAVLTERVAIALRERPSHVQTLGDKPAFVHEALSTHAYTLDPDFQMGKSLMTSLGWCSDLYSIYDASPYLNRVNKYHGYVCRQSFAYNI